MLALKVGIKSKYTYFKYNVWTQVSAKVDRIIFIVMVVGSNRQTSWLLQLTTPTPSTHEVGSLCTRHINVIAERVSLCKYLQKMRWRAQNTLQNYTFVEKSHYKNLISNINKRIARLRFYLNYVLYCNVFCSVMCNNRRV